MSQPMVTSIPAQRLRRSNYEGGQACAPYATKSIPAASVPRSTSYRRVEPVRHLPEATSQREYPQNRPPTRSSVSHHFHKPPDQTFSLSSIRRTCDLASVSDSGIASSGASNVAALGNNPATHTVTRYSERLLSSGGLTSPFTNVYSSSDHRCPSSVLYREEGPVLSLNHVQRYATSVASLPSQLEPPLRLTSVDSQLRGTHGNVKLHFQRTNEWTASPNRVPPLPSRYNTPRDVANSCRQQDRVSVGLPVIAAPRVQRLQDRAHVPHVLDKKHVISAVSNFLMRKTVSKADHDVPLLEEEPSLCDASSGQGMSFSRASRLECFDRKQTSPRLSSESSPTTGPEVPLKLSRQRCQKLAEEVDADSQLRCTLVDAFPLAAMAMQEALGSTHPCSSKASTVFGPPPDIGIDYAIESSLLHDIKKAIRASSGNKLSPMRGSPSFETLRSYLPGLDCWLPLQSLLKSFLTSTKHELSQVRSSCVVRAKFEDFIRQADIRLVQKLAQALRTAVIMVTVTDDASLFVAHLVFALLLTEITTSSTLKQTFAFSLAYMPRSPQIGDYPWSTLEKQAVPLAEFLATALQSAASTSNVNSCARSRCVTDLVRRLVAKIACSPQTLDITFGLIASKAFLDSAADATFSSGLEPLHLHSRAKRRVKTQDTDGPTTITPLVAGKPTTWASNERDLLGLKTETGLPTSLLGLLDGLGLEAAVFNAIIFKKPERMHTAMEVLGLHRAEPLKSDIRRFILRLRVVRILSQALSLSDKFVLALKSSRGDPASDAFCRCPRCQPESLVTALTNLVLSVILDADADLLWSRWTIGPTADVACSGVTPENPSAGQKEAEKVALVSVLLILYLLSKMDTGRTLLFAQRQRVASCLAKWKARSNRLCDAVEDGRQRVDVKSHALTQNPLVKQMASAVLELLLLGPRHTAPPPAAHLTDASRLKHYCLLVCCAGCGSNFVGSRKLKICAGCHLTRYCNRECQQRHWLQEHGIACSDMCTGEISHHS